MNHKNQIIIKTQIIKKIPTFVQVIIKHLKIINLIWIIAKVPIFSNVKNVRNILVHKKNLKIINAI